jgi:hypothetical protein
MMMKKKKKKGERGRGEKKKKMMMIKKKTKKKKNKMVMMMKKENQQNAQYCSLDIYITLNISMCFDPQGAIIKEKSKTTQYKIKLVTFIQFAWRRRVK